MPKRGKRKPGSKRCGPNWRKRAENKTQAAESKKELDKLRKDCKALDNISKDYLMDREQLNRQIEEVLEASDGPCEVSLLFLAFPDVTQGAVRLAVAKLCEAGRIEAVEGKLQLAGAVVEDDSADLDDPQVPFGGLIYSHVGINDDITLSVNTSKDVGFSVKPLGSQGDSDSMSDSDSISDLDSVSDSDSISNLNSIKYSNGYVSYLVESPDDIELGQEGLPILEPAPQEIPIESTLEDSALDDDVLIGLSSSSEKTYERLSDEEIDSLLADFNKDCMYRDLDYLSDEPLIGADSPSPVVDGDEGERSDRGVFYRDSVKRLCLSTRSSRVLERAKIKRINELVSRFDSVAKLPNCGERSVNEMQVSLASSALDIDVALNNAQKHALMSVSESSRYVYNAFGVLCKAPALEIEDEGQSYSVSRHLDNVSLNDIGISQINARRFADYGIYTVGDAKKTGRERLLSLRGIGHTKVWSLFKAIEKLETEGPPSDSARNAVLWDVNDAKVFLDAYPQNVLSVIERVSDLCEQRSYLVHRVSFAVCYADLALEEISKCNGDYSMAVTSLFDNVEDSEALKNACVIRVRRQIEKLREKANHGSFKTTLKLFTGSAWRRAIDEVLDAFDDVRIDEESGTISLVLPSVNDWVESLFPKQKAIIKLRLAGKTLADCGAELGLTRERVRQLQEKALGKRPALAEDVNLHLVSTYSMNAEQFSDITGLDVDVYNYLSLIAETKKSERIPIADALDDDDVTEEQKREIRRISDVGFGYLEGRRIHLDRRSIIDAIVETYASEEPISFTQLIDEYNAFLEANDAEGLEAFAFTDERMLKAFVERDDCIMFASAPRGDAEERRPIRYYDWNAYDFSALQEMLSSGRWADVECSALVLYRDDAMLDIIESLDLRNEYELHSAIKRTCSQVVGLNVLKRPNLVFGNGDRKEQILELIKEAGPIDAHGLSREYERRYGVSEATFRGSYLKDFEVYCRNGVYSFVDEELDSEQSMFLREELANDYISLSVLKMRFKAHFPDASTSLINERSLSAHGYHASNGLAIRNGIDESALFGRLIDSNKMFSVDAPGFGIDVFNNEAFISQLRIRERTFAVVEIEKGTYIKTDALLQLDRPIDASVFKDYIDAALDFMVDGTPYTIRSLVLDGFVHPLDTLREDMGFGDYFYASVLSQAYVGGRVKIATINGIKVFCECSGTFSSPAFLESILKDLDAVEVDELAGLLEDKYGIEVGTAYLRNTVKRSSLYYNESIDMVFSSVEVYARKVDEWI